MTALELAGPPVAGLLVATSASLSLETPIAFWAIAVVVLLLVRGSFKGQQNTGQRPVMRAEIVEGLRFVVALVFSWSGCSFRGDFGDGARALDSSTMGTCVITVSSTVSG
jgi:hypothetical protein